MKKKKKKAAAADRGNSLTAENAREEVAHMLIVKALKQELKQWIGYKEDLLFMVVWGGCLPICGKR